MSLSKALKRHYFVGRFYPTPKKTDDPEYCKIDDFLSNELKNIKINELALKFKHNDDVDAGKIIDSFELEDKSYFIIGYIDTSTTAGVYFANEIATKGLPGLSMKHRFYVKPNFQTFEMDVTKVPLEISLVDVPDFEGCNIFYNFSDLEIHRVLPILVDKIKKENKEIEEKTFVENFLQLLKTSNIEEIMQSTTTPAVPQPPVVTTTTPVTPVVPVVQPSASVAPQVAVQNAVPQESVLGKRPADTTTAPVANKEQKVIDPWEVIKKDDISKYEPNTQKDILGTLIKSHEELKLKAKQWDDLQAVNTNKKKEEIEKNRTEYLKELGQVLPKEDLEKIDAQKVEQMNKMIAQNDHVGLETLNREYTAVVAHSVKTRAETQKMKEEFQKQSEEMKKEKERRMVEQNYGWPSVSNSTFVPSSTQTPPATLSHFQKMPSEFYSSLTPQTPAATTTPAAVPAATTPVAPVQQKPAENQPMTAFQQFEKNFMSFVSNKQ
jgi:hypothetical protein